MPQTVVPIIHVPGVSATVDWYTSIGFKLIRQNQEAGEVNWAKQSFGNSELKLSAGGKPTSDNRREVDLYITTDNVDDLYRRFKDRVQVVEGPHDTFYGHAGVHYTRRERILGRLRTACGEVACRLFNA